MDTATMHPDTAKLAVQLQLADIDDLLLGLDPEKSENDDTIDPFALELMQESLRLQLQVLEGQCLVLNILREEHANREAFDRLIREENQAAQDHAFACSLAGLAAPESSPVFAPQSSPEYAKDAQTWAHYAQSCPDFDGTTLVCREDGSRHAQDFSEAPPITLPSSSTRKGKGKVAEGEGPGTHVRCVSCYEFHPRFDVLELSCKRDNEQNAHAYCRECLVNLFEACIKDARLFPARCCGKRIPVDDCRLFFSKDLIQRLTEREEELSTPNPVYCSNTACSKFIRPSAFTGRDSTSCKSCGEDTCLICKGRPHQGACPEDPGVKQVMTVAKEEKWQRCEKCKQMVELKGGCFHMTCKCGHQFCYLCGARHKTCSCTGWDEYRLLNDGVAGLAALDDPSLLRTEAEAIATAVNASTAITGASAGMDDDQLICNHLWERQFQDDGVDTECPICDSHRLQFINVCHGCKARACNRCLHNRL